MKRPYSPIVELWAVCLGLGLLTRAFAIESVSAPPPVTTGRSEKAAYDATLTSMKAYVDPIMYCQARNLIYMPNHPQRDANGCVDPLAKLTVCHDKGLVYYPASTLPKDADGCVMPSIGYQAFSVRVFSMQCSGYPGCSSSANLNSLIGGSTFVNGNLYVALNSPYGNTSLNLNLGSGAAYNLVSAHVSNNTGGWRCNNGTTDEHLEASVNGGVASVWSNASWEHCANAYTSIPDVTFTGQKPFVSY